MLSLTCLKKNYAMFIHQRFLVPLLVEFLSYGCFMRKLQEKEEISVHLVLRKLKNYLKQRQMVILHWGHGSC